MIIVMVYFNAPFSSNTESIITKFKVGSQLIELMDPGLNLGSDPPGKNSFS